MSTGSLIGAVVGGVIGFFIGGPMGAMYGAGMGFAIGMMIDPMTPDVPQAGTPDIQDSSMSSSIGSPLPDLLGTGKITGHLLCYGNEHSYTVPQQEQSGGKGGGGSFATVAEGADQPGSTIYYMTWVLGICIGPVDVLYSVFKGEDLVWDGKLVCPDTGGQETITLDGMGECTFYFGTDDQTANVIINDLIPDSTLNSPMRKFCWVLLNDCRIGNVNRTPTLSFLIGKNPVCSFSEQNIIQEYDYNPAHAMWYILHNLAGLPESWLNESAFNILALSLLQEYRGISILFVNQQNALTYLQNLNMHVDCILNYDSSGRFTPKLIRDDYSVDSIPDINEDNLIENPTFTRKAWIDTVSEIKVQYTELIEVERNKDLAGILYWSGENGYYKTIHDGNILDKASLLELIPGSEDWKVKDVFVRNQSLHALKQDGTLWGRGYNDFGQLGTGYNDLRPPWRQVSGTWIKVIHGDFFSMALNAANQLFLCGRGSGSDFLNIGSTSTNNTIFKQDLENAAWQHVTGYNHRMGVANTVWPNPFTTVPPYAITSLGGFGQNSYHNMGFESPTTFFDGWYALALSGSNVVDIQLGNQTSYLAIGEPGNFELWFTGLCTDGQGGVGYIPGDNIVHTFTQVVGGPWKSYSAGNNHLVALKSNGTAYSCGNNYKGKLGQGDTVSYSTLTQMGTKSNFVKCVASPSCTYLLTDSGEIWTCGTSGFIGRTYNQPGDVSYTVLGQEGTKKSWLNMWGCSSGILAIK